MYKLSELVEKEGFQLLVGDWKTMNDIKPLGEPGDNLCTVCEGSTIVAPEDSFDYCYDVSHEIAEFRCGFKHSAKVFIEQANILARWLKYTNV